MGSLLDRLARTLPDLRRWLLKQPFFTSKVLPRLPRNLRWQLRRIYFAPLDLVERLRGHHDDMVPPHAARFTGSAGEDFLAFGDMMVDALKDGAGLTADSRILEIGSGVGRLAVPLTNALGPSGNYDGLDIVPSGVRWCQQKITPNFPNFQFALADIQNAEYNPNGTLRATDFTFPYPSAHFDVVVMYSVFTHMGPDEMEHYIDEIARVLRPGGVVLTSYIVVNDATRALMADGRAMYNFTTHVGNHWLLTDNAKKLELGIAYDEAYLRDVYQRAGFDVESLLHFGDWRAPGSIDRSAPSLDQLVQDIVTAVKV